MKKLVTQLMELQRYKEELAAIGLLTLVLLAIRWVSATLWPTTGQYDLAAETETVFWTVLRVVIYSLAAWTGLRVAAPSAYNWLKHGIVDGFETLTAEQKTSLSTRMYAILFFGLILLALGGCRASAEVAGKRLCVVESCTADVGVREATGRNDGPQVEAYLAHVGLGKGYAWCAAFVSYHLSRCSVANPRSAWGPAFASASHQVWTPRKATRQPLPGDVFSLFYSNLGRVGHVGFVAGRDGRYILTVEGNTSGPGSREGDGVYARRRELSKVHAITNYISDETASVRRTGAAVAGLRKQAPHHGNEYHRAPGDYHDAGAARHGDHHAACAGAPAGARAGAWAVATDGEQAKGQSHQYAEQRWGGADRRLYVRQRGHKDQAVGPVDQGEPGARDQDQGAAREGAMALAVLAAGRPGLPVRAAGRGKHPQIPTLSHG